MERTTIKPVRFFTEFNCLLPYKKMGIAAKATVWGNTSFDKITLTKIEAVITDGNQQHLLKDKGFIEEIKIWLNSQYFKVTVAADLMQFTLRGYGQAHTV